MYLNVKTYKFPETPNPKSKKENKDWKDNNGVPMNCCISFPWSRWIYIDMFCNFQRLLWNGKMTHAHLSSDTSPFSLTLWFFGHYRLQFQVIFNYIVILFFFFFGILSKQGILSILYLDSSYRILLWQTSHTNGEIFIFLFFFSRWYPVSPNNIKAISHGFCVFISHKHQLIDLFNNQK